MQKKIAFIMIAATGFAANADIVQVNEFESLQIEGFNDLDMGVFERNPVSIFDGLGEIRNTNNSWLHTTGSWQYKSRSAAYEGSRLLGTSSGGVEYRFKTAQQSFGGFFSTIADTPDANIQFFKGDTLVGSDVLNASVGGDWAWNGWSGDVEFDRVTVESNDNRSGFILHDAVRILSTEVPTQGSLAIIGTGLFIAGRRRRA